MERAEVIRIAKKVNDQVVERAPEVMRPGGVGFGVGALTLDHSWVLAGLGVGVSLGSALVIEMRKRAKNMRSDKHQSPNA